MAYTIVREGKIPTYSIQLAQFSCLCFIGFSLCVFLPSNQSIEDQFYTIQCNRNKKIFYLLFIWWAHLHSYGVHIHNPKKNVYDTIVNHNIRICCLLSAECCFNAKERRKNCKWIKNYNKKLRIEDTHITPFKMPNNICIVVCICTVLWMLLLLFFYYYSFSAFNRENV